MSSSAPDAKRAKTWHIPSSVKAKRTHNPIRKIVDQIDLSKKNPDKEFIPLSLGEYQINLYPARVSARTFEQACMHAFKWLHLHV
jgi:hypothetical protein